MGEPHVAVYISAALNATAGYLVIVPRRQVVELDMSVDEAMKMIITCGVVVPHASHTGAARVQRSEEHTSELQSQSNLVCRLLLEKKKNVNGQIISSRTRNNALNA